MFVRVTDLSRLLRSPQIELEATGGFQSFGIMNDADYLARIL